MGLMLVAAAPRWTLRRAAFKSSQVHGCFQVAAGESGGRVRICPLSRGFRWWERISSHLPTGSWSGKARRHWQNLHRGGSSPFGVTAAGSLLPVKGAEARAPPFQRRGDVDEFRRCPDASRREIDNHFRPTGGAGCRLRRWGGRIAPRNHAAVESRPSRVGGDTRPSFPNSRLEASPTRVCLWKHG
jgi:hypothetical protein